MCRGLLALLFTFSVFFNFSCSSVHYIYQAGKGQLEINNLARPIAQVLADDRTEPEIKRLLSEIPKIKSYGEKNGLKPTRNYTEYVNLKRNAVVWSVSASQPLKFEPMVWSFPFVGSFAYLGWFSQENADEHAAELKKKGLDVYVRGVSAYSTIGWFRDPILSTMIQKGESAFGSLVNVVLHESVHATLYINGQSKFNESLASFVADRLTLDYLQKELSGDSVERDYYIKSVERGEKRRKRLHQTFLTLRDLYSSSKSDEEKLAEKEKILEKVRIELKFNKKINNAYLYEFKLYSTDSGFEKLYSACHLNWDRFFSVLSQVKEKSFEKNQQADLKPVLEPLTKKGCV